ncbi:hypothetical protein FQR65_LT14362 [Abscondita terminalis]|nr:hypothetical protein FQR65_LT14362 [Abscondita terminalis]
MKEILLRTKELDINRALEICKTREVTHERAQRLLVKEEPVETIQLTTFRRRHRYKRNPSREVEIGIIRTVNRLIPLIQKEGIVEDQVDNASTSNNIEQENNTNFDESSNDYNDTSSSDTYDDIGGLSFNEYEDVHHNTQEPLVDELMFPDASLTRSDVLTMVYCLGLRHKLSNEARSDLIDLLKLCANLQNDNSFSTSNYKICKIFDPPDNAIKYNFYCKSCYGIVEDQVDNASTSNNIEQENNTNFDESSNDYSDTSSSDTYEDIGGLSFNEYEDVHHNTQEPLVR